MAASANDTPWCEGPEADELAELLAAGPLHVLDLPPSVAADLPLSSSPSSAVRADPMPDLPRLGEVAGHPEDPTEVGEGLGVLFNAEGIDTLDGSLLGSLPLMMDFAPGPAPTAAGRSDTASSLPPPARPPHLASSPAAQPKVKKKRGRPRKTEKQLWHGSQVW